ncbi:MAG: protein translocase subunit SecD, partial [Lysobacter sp.]
MLTYERWKYVVLVLAILFSTLYALPNLYQKDPSVQVTASRGAPIDQALADRVADTLKQAEIPTKQVEIVGDNLLVRLTGTDFQSKAADALAPVLGNDYVTALNLASTVPAWLDKIGA